MKKVFIWLSVAAVAVLFCAVAGQAQALSWEQVSTDGFGSANNQLVFAPQEWGGYMYLAIGNTINGGSVWRSSGGTDWTKVSADGFGNSANQYVEDFAVFRGDLFTISTAALSGEPTRVWRSRNGTDWAQANVDGFGDANNNYELVSLQVFGDHLYAAVGNQTTGVEVWRTADGASWTQVNTDGFGSNAYGANSLYVFNDQLYCGTIAVGGGRIWRTADGTTWTAASSAGFGDSSNSAVAGMVKFDNKLYAFTLNGTSSSSQVWSSPDGTTWSKVTTAFNGDWPSIHPMVVNGTIYTGIRNWVAGANLWRTDNGVDWAKEIENGKGDANNFAFYSMTQWGDRMYVATSNSTTGVEIWRSEKIGPFDITTTSLSTASEGKSYEQKISVANGTPAHQWSISDGALPDGLNIDVDTGTISGTPKEGGNHTFTVQVTDYSTPTQTATEEFTMKVINKGHIVTGAGAGAAPWLRSYSAYGNEASKPKNLMTFAATFRGGINVATGDLDGDGIDEIIAAPRGAGAPLVRVFDKQGTPKFNKNGFYAYDRNLRCGTDVAAADLDGNGIDEIITTPGTGCGPQVKIFNGNGQSVLSKGFFAYSQGLRVGLRVSAGDVNKDGKAEIVTVPERGTQAQVRIFDYTGKSKGTTGFYPYGTLPTGGDVAVADLNGDGKDEIVTVPGEGFPAQVRIFDSTGKAKLNQGFYAYARSIKTGFLISAGDLNSDGKAEIVTVPKTANAAQVRTFKYNGQAVFTPGFYAYAATQKAGADVAVANF